MDSADTFSGLMSSVRLYSPPILRVILRLAARAIVGITSWAPNLTIVAMKVPGSCSAHLCMSVGLSHLTHRGQQGPYSSSPELP